MQSRYRTSQALCFLLTGALSLIAHTASGQDEVKRVEVTGVKISPMPIQPGKQSIVTVEVEVKPGYHGQSHTPKDAFSPKFTVKLEDNPALKFGEPVYPEGKDVDFKALGVLNVYVGTISVHFPVELTSGAVPADATIKGKVKIQVCDDNVCYQPVALPFQINAAAGGPTTGPATKPTTAPAAAAETDAGPIGQPPIVLTGFYSSGALHRAIVAATEGKSVAANDSFWRESAAIR